MPGFDRRGPNGEGSMTGRGRGRCSQDFKDDVNVQRENKNFEDSEFSGFGRRGTGRRQGRGSSQRCCGRRMRKGCRR